MAEVKVRIQGEASNFNKALAEALSKLRSLGAGAANAGRSVGSGLAKAARAAASFASTLGGALLFTDIVGQAAAFIKKELTEAWEEPRKAAIEAGKVFKGVFEDLVDIDLGRGSTFIATTRQDLLDLAEDSKAKIQELETALRSIGGGAAISGALFLQDFFSDVGVGAVKQQNAVRTLLEEEKAVLSTLVEQLGTLEAQQRIREKLRGTLTEQPPGPTKEDLFNFFQPRPGTPDPFDSIRRLGSFQTQGTPQPGLPDLPRELKKTEDAFDALSLQILTNQKAVQAGLIPVYDGLVNKAALLEQQLFFMLESGVAPTNKEFQQMLGVLKETDEQIANLNSNVKGGAIAFQLIGDIGSEVLGEIIFKLEEATNEAAKFRNVLRRIGQKLIDIGISTLVTVGIGALTGNPIGFGAALGTVLGIPLGGGGGAAGGGGGAPIGGAGAIAIQNGTLDQLSLSSVGQASIKVEPTITRISGGDFILGLQEASNARGGGPTIQFS